MGLGGIIKQVVAWGMPSLFVVRGRTRNLPLIAVTFDDGPHPDNTPRILDVLDAHQAHATFFVQGDQAAHYPDLVREIVRRGHEIGNHGYSHLDAGKTPIRDYVADVLRAQDVLEQAVGRKLPRLFRPPFGAVSPGSVVALLRHGFRFVFWSIDSRDSYLPDSVAVLNFVAAQRVAPGSILLFHDDYSHTTEALPSMVEHWQGKGFRLVTIGSLLGMLPDRRTADQGSP